MVGVDGKRGQARAGGRCFAACSATTCASGVAASHIAAGGRGAGGGVCVGVCIGAAVSVCVCIGFACIGLMCAFDVELDIARRMNLAHRSGQHDALNPPLRCLVFLGVAVLRPCGRLQHQCVALLCQQVLCAAGQVFAA